MISKRFQVDEENSNNRVDIFLAKNLDSISRGIVQQLILDGQVLVNGEQVKRNHLLKIDDVVDISFEIKPEGDDEAQDIPLNIIFENDDFIVIDKQAGLTVHPGAGQKDATLINGLLFIRPKQRELPRYGLVHRLDKDTSGLVVIARKNGFRNHIAEQFQNREVEKKYLAVIKGEIIGALTIDKPIARDRQNRTKMKVDESGREAISEAISLESFGGYSVVEVKIETGRTHQIRVHLSSNKTPIIGDKAYGSGSQLIKNLSDNLKDKILSFPRQALHAYQLAFLDASNEMQTYKSNPPDDILGLIESLKSNENA